MYVKQSTSIKEISRTYRVETDRKYSSLKRCQTQKSCAASSTLMAIMTFTAQALDDYYYEENSTANYSLQDALCDEVVLDLQDFYTVFQPVLYSVIFLLGVAGNGLMITVLLTRWRQMRITEIYLLHLALADLVLLFTFPFEVVDSTTGWVFSEFLCKLNGLLKNLNLICSSCLLGCIGFDRYLAIVHAIPSMQTRRPKTVHLTCTLLWLVCLGLSTPDAVFLSVIIKNTNPLRFTCFYHSYGIHAYNWVVTNRVIRNMCFFLPLAVMSYCYTALVITLSKSQKSQRKKVAIRLALIITSVFCFCWLPYNISLLIKSLAEFELITYKSCESYILLDQVVAVTESLGISHCCLNPFLYAFVGVRFRNELIQLLCKLGCRRICLPFITARNNSQHSSSDGLTTIGSVLT
ncbi:C-X-C chemokine receptor type 5 [Pholidichthys leucotaenia]